MKSRSRLAIQISVICFLMTLFLLSPPALLVAQEKTTAPKKPVVGTEQPQKDDRKPEKATPRALSKPGEPVPGAEIYVELENDEPIAVVRGITSDKGAWNFRIKHQGTYKLVIDLSRKDKSYFPKGFKSLWVKLDKGGKGPVTFGTKTGKNPLLFETPDFKLDDVKRAYTVTVTFSGVHNYGINDEGIK